MTTFTILWTFLTLFHLSKTIYLPSSNYYHLQRNQIKDIEVTENARLTTPELVTKFGYPVESHTITTDDGYILTLHRIPYSTKSGPAIDKPAVLIQHGFISNSAESVLAGPGNSFSLFLADSGYDVWLGNARSNRYSRRHVTLNPNGRKYWDFTWSDIAYYDIPATIDHILQITRQRKIFYVGHSRGTTVSYAMCSERPEYNDKLKLIISLAPVSYMFHIPNPLFHFLSRNRVKVEKIFKTLGIYNLNGHPKQLGRIGHVFCKEFSPTQPICPVLAFSLGGFDYKNFNISLIPIIVGHIPDAMAVKELNHYGQEIASGKFRHFDYGRRKNILVYNRATPPDYNLTKITAPVALFCSDNDLQSSTTDAEQLYRELGNPIEKILLPEGPNHYSYFFGMHMREVYFEKVLAIMQRY